MANAKIGKKFTKGRAEEFRQRLLEWYDSHARVLPWRYTKKQKPDPYCVWLSEIMLQQTTVAAVGPYYRKFTEKWPDIAALAGARQEEIIQEWAGLGYYSRARNLHKCAGIVAKDLRGVFPQEQEELKRLPGIGDYTSGAIRAIAFNKPATVVDGNVERIMARYFAWPVPMPDAKKNLKNLAAGLYDHYEDRPGDLAQALMDLGATICTPKSPRCGLCPVSQHCEGRKKKIAANLPLQNKKKAKPKKFGYVYWVTNSKGQVLVERRPEKGLLGGMSGLPTSEWALKTAKSPPAGPEIMSHFKTGDWASKPVSILHSFTHFDLELVLKTGKLGKSTISGPFRWLDKAQLEKAGFPTVFKKAVRLFMQDTPSG